MAVSFCLVTLVRLGAQSQDEKRFVPTVLVGNAYHWSPKKSLPMSRLPLNTLTAFRAVGELQNLRAAASTLHLTHSAVSQQIRGLEEQLGFALFERRGRRVVLNPAGEALLRSVQAALAQLDEGVQAAAAAASGTAQRLRVTVLPSFAQRWLLPRMGRWRDRHPDLALEIDASPQLGRLAARRFPCGTAGGTRSRGPDWKWSGCSMHPCR
jgi:LysR family glycine cleavage system transcriptional activator